LLEGFSRLFDRAVEDLKVRRSGPPKDLILHIIEGEFTPRPPRPIDVGTNPAPLRVEVLPRAGGTKPLEVDVCEIPKPGPRPSAADLVTRFKQLDAGRVD